MGTTQLNDRSAEDAAMSAQGELTPITARAFPLRRLADQLEASDPYTSGHSLRVARYSTLVGAQIGISGDSLRTLRTAAMLHDVGKIAVPVGVLRKPGALTDWEFELIKGHPAEGARLIESVVGDQELADVVRHHHERLDGHGYPDGLKGARIPLGARVIAVADTFDAICSRRPYRPARSFQAALDGVVAAAGTQLDPTVVEGFTAVFDALPGMGSLDLLSDSGERLVRGAHSSLAGRTPDPAHAEQFSGWRARQLGAARAARSHPGRR
jgi:putative nucleotidyltransferase with HDIG domain